MPALPTGTVTFLFTDVEGSTRLWEHYPVQMRQALICHDALIEALVSEHSGTLVRPRGEGDSRFAVFSRASDALGGACAIQVALVRQQWPLPEPLRVRIAIHTGEADVRDGDYYGSAVNRCARLRAIAFGGQVVLSGVTAAVIGEQLPDGAVVRDLGTHRLKDLGQPERIYQLLHPELPADFPPLKSVDVLLTNLPLQSTSFVGRDTEISELRHVLGGARVVTLTGSGGAGKTRLALHIAADLLDEFEDGVWLAELAPLADGALLPQAVAQAVGVAEDPGRPLLETLLENLRPKRTLVVLDNCEHLVRACAILAEALLRACPDLHILATSREPLGLAGEVAWSVPPLTILEAARLFADRAATSRPGFVLNDAHRVAVAELCRRLDGLPLAIELAAARVRVLSPRQIAERLDDRFRLLTHGVRTAPTRQQTLRAAIDWSHGLLSAPEQAAFARLSVFAGGFDLEAAEAVSADDDLELGDVLDLLSQLVDKSLVVTEPALDCGPVRYRLPETLREYARERLAERDETAVVQRRHARHYIIQAELAEPNLKGPEQVAWLDRLEADHDNLLAVLKWAVANGEVETGLLLGNAIFRFWVRRHPREGSEWLPLLLSLLGTAAPEIRARALNVAGNFATVRGDLQQAVALHEANVRVRRSLGEPWELSIALNIFGSVSTEVGQYATARASLEESLALRRQLDKPRAIAVVLASLAELERRVGNLRRAAALGHESLSLARATHDESLVATILNNLGSVATARGDCEEAAMLLDSAVVVFVTLGDQHVVAECCQRLALVANLRELGTLAARLLGVSSALRELVGGVMFPDERAEYERGVAGARALIGDAAYAVAWADGHAMPLERVLADARASLIRVQSA